MGRGWGGNGRLPRLRRQRNFSYCGMRFTKDEGGIARGCCGVSGSRDRSREDGFDSCQAEVLDFFFLVTFHAQRPFERSFHFSNRGEDGGEFNRDASYVGGR